MIYLICVVRGLLDPVFSFKDEYKSEQDSEIKEERAYTPFSLACLEITEIRLRNEEVINSTRNMIYSLKVFYFLLYRRRYFLLVSELI